MSNFLTKYKEYIFILIIALLSFLLFRSCDDGRRVNKAYLQNTKALNEQINTYKDKNGLLINEKAILIADGKELKELNEGLGDEVDYWKKKKQKVEVVIKTEIVYRDTGSTKTILTQIGKNEYQLSFNYETKDSLLKIKGNNKIKVYPKILDASKNEIELNPVVSNTEFTDIQLNIPLTLGIKKEKGTKRAYVKTPNENFRVSSLDAAEIDSELKKSNRRFGVGAFVGYGVSLDKQNVLRLGPSVGVALQYNIIRF